MTEPAATASGAGDLAFWAALPAAARSRIARALREGGGGRGDGSDDDDRKGIDAEKKTDKENNQPLSVPPPSFRPPPRRGVSIVHALVSLSTAAQAAFELDELLEERGSPGGIVGGEGGGGGERGAGNAPSAPAAARLVRSDVACWLGEGEDENEGFPSLPPALSAVRSALLSLRAVLEAEGKWDVGGRASVMSARYESGGRYARHSDEKSHDDDSDSKSPRRRRRTVTAICYLDDAGRKTREDEEEEEEEEEGGGGRGGGGGGELVLFPWSSLSSLSPPFSRSSSFPEPRVVVPPSPGLSVCFDSTLQHEVLPLIRSRGPRRAVTVFFYSSSSSGGGGGGEKEGEGEEAEEDEEKAISPPTTTTTETPTSTTAASEARRRLRITRAGHIFVSVPSFRDPETRWTLHSLFESADHPEKVTAGVVWQVSPGGGGENCGENENENGENGDDDDDLMKPVAKNKKDISFYHSRVRSARLPDKDASGPCAARAIAASLWKGEEFFLSVDAHSRFARGWDTKLTKMLLEAERLEEKENASRPSHPVLTTYPPSYEGEGPAARIPEQNENHFATLLCASHFGPEGVLRLVGKKWRWRKEKNKISRSCPPPPRPRPPSSFTPIRSLFWAAGFSFSRAHFGVCAPTRYEDSGSAAVAASPLLSTSGAFWGEEPDVAARALHAGFRFWAPPPAAAAVFTRYDRSQVRGAPPVGARGSGEAAAAGRRLAAVFGGGNSDDDCDSDPLFSSSESEIENRYGRDVAGMWKKALGVDWRERTIEERAKRGGVDENDEEVELLGSDEEGDGGGKGFSVV